jgi:hypothetical protein
MVDSSKMAIPEWKKDMSGPLKYLENIGLSCSMDM